MIELPPGVRVENTLTAVGPSGLTLILGQQNPVLGRDYPDRMSIETKINWLMSAHLPPSAMKVLRNQLNEMVSVYELSHGEIKIQVPARPALSIVRPLQPESGEEGRPAHHHPLDEYRQGEHAPSPSEPTP